MKTAHSIFKTDEQVTILILPKVVGMVTGVSCIHSNHPRYRLTYRDGRTEEATCEPVNRACEFSVIDAVQSINRLRMAHEKALRTYESAHAVWFSTPIHSDAQPAIKAALDLARSACDTAYLACNPNHSILL